MLSSYAARSCPVKTQNAFNPTLVMPVREADQAAEARAERRIAHRRRVLDRWLSLVAGSSDLRVLEDEPPDVRENACREALSSGAPLILGATLPSDSTGQRVGKPDVLLRGPDSENRRPGYYPVVVKWHKIIAPQRVPAVEGSDTQELPKAVVCSTLREPQPDPDRNLSGYVLRFGTREADFLQLAHYTRMLQAAGFAAAGRAWGGVIGTDQHSGLSPFEMINGDDDVVLAWADLNEPEIRTFSRTDPRGWRWRSLLERYDYEHRFRLAIAEVAQRQNGFESDPALCLRPIVNSECATCPWWTICRSALQDDDVSLRIERGRLAAREILALRDAGIETVPQLAAADLDPLLADYLPQVRHRTAAEVRLRTAARRARMLVAGVGFDRESSGPIDVAAAEIEVDFDLETSADGRIYLWGFRVQTDDEQPCCQQFARFSDLDEAGELALAREALGWLQHLIRSSTGVRVYHYSGFEVAMLRALANRTEDQLLRWAADYADGEFVDLLEVIKMHYFGASGLGLKAIAQHAGFGWRDSDPGGLNSQRWFTAAVHGSAEERPLARRRVLEYNEDDVNATAWLRAWLREQ
jgi:predicted RecB family nuclease